MLSKRLAGTAAICLLLAAGATACGDDKTSATKLDTAKLSAEEIQKKAKDALAGAGSVKVVGEIAGADADGKKVTLDLVLDTQGHCKGNIAMPGMGKFEVLGDGKQVYLKPDAEFLSNVAGGGEDGAKAAELFKGRYISGVQDDPEMKDFTTLCNLKDLSKSFTEDNDASNITKGSAGTVNGVKTFSVKSKESDGGETVLHVATEGTPYPVRIEKTGKEGGRMDFSEIDKAVTVQAPPADQVIDYSKFKSEATTA
ncbi:hypothetical protein ABTX81_20905 [Kitasatospora sp. NPDC097605]|uniref:hypothetical protein n=1 Tax=Kitasatospora sp. NPDC097605 TaxID=3157226 RepID=UPI003325D03A